MKLISGRKTVTTAGTAVRLSSEAAESVAVTALSTNTGTICVGGPEVVASAGTRAGTPLAANQTATFDTDDVADIWIDATVNGEGVSYTAVSTE